MSDRDLLIDASEVVRGEEWPLCLHCLGRVIAKVGHGFSNDERGRIAREALGDGAPPDATGTALCMTCGGLMDGLSLYADLVMKELSGWEFGSFLIGCRIDDELTGNEKTLWERRGITTGEEIKSEFNREVGKAVEKSTGKNVDFKIPDITAIVDTRYDTVSLDVRSVFFYGRYRKLERGMPQTRWPCRRCKGIGCERCDGTGKMYQSSVEEIVCAPLMDMASGSEHHFHGLGREDIDVRMLGNGRPFVAEVTTPRKRSLDLEEAKTIISSSGRVEIDGLTPADRKLVQEIKAMRCDKEYLALIDVQASNEGLVDAISSLDGATIEQQTPTRVKRRRADLLRERQVRSISLLEHDPENGNARVGVLGEAGLYIKELLHGDEGRTNPSLAGILDTPVVVRELDVVNVHCDPLSERDDDEETS